MSYADLAAIEARRDLALSGGLLSRTDHIAKDIIADDLSHLIEEVKLLRRRLLFAQRNRITG